MRVTSHKTFMCNKLCNCLFSDILAKRPALDAWFTLDGQRVSRVWTVAVLWTGGGCPYSGRFCLITLVGLGESRLNLFNDDHQNTGR
jgi:hypothetical protein